MSSGKSKPRSRMRCAPRTARRQIVKRVLFVDDEPRLLQGLKRMLRGTRQEWELGFAASGAEALATLEQSPYDIVVSDMRMPGMDGAQLLSEVMRRYPKTVRIILSGQSDEESILRCVGKAHQFLAKPCDPDTLTSTIERASALRELLTSESLTKLISQVESLPSLPSLYMMLLEVLSKPEASLQMVADVISRDVGMMARVLQLVNSAFFGFHQHVSDPGRAVSVLGLKTIGALALSAKIFAEYKDNGAGTFDIGMMNDHSIAVAGVSRRIIRAEGGSAISVDDALTGRFAP